MTELETSPVTRRLKFKWRGKQVIVTLRADEEIEFRLQRERLKVHVPLSDVFRYAQRSLVDVEIPGRKRRVFD